MNIHLQAFCTTEMIESYAAIATGNLPELSTQQVRKAVSLRMSFAKCFAESLSCHVLEKKQLMNSDDKNSKSTID